MKENNFNALVFANCFKWCVIAAICFTLIGSVEKLFTMWVDYLHNLNCLVK